jgi:transposase InsO family protein
MSRRGNCLDDAPMESFFGSLKAELVHRVAFPTREAARRAVFECVETLWAGRAIGRGRGPSPNPTPAALE